MSKTYSNKSSVQLKDDIEVLLGKIAYFSGKLNEAEEQSKLIVDRSKELEEITTKFDLLKQAYAKMEEMYIKKELEDKDLSSKISEAKETLKITEQLLSNVSKNGEEEVERYKVLIANLQKKFFASESKLKTIEKELKDTNSDISAKIKEKEKIDSKIVQANKELKSSKDELLENTKKNDSILVEIKASGEELSALLAENIKLDKDNKQIISKSKKSVEINDKRENEINENAKLNEESYKIREARLNRREELLEMQRKDLITVKKSLEKYTNEPIDINI